MAAAACAPERRVLAVALRGPVAPERRVPVTRGALAADVPAAAVATTPEVGAAVMAGPVGALGEMARMAGAMATDQQQPLARQSR